MHVKDKIGPLMAKDFHNQNVKGLWEWFSTFDKACESLEAEIGGLCLSHAIQKNQWLNIALLISIDDLPRKKDQIFELHDNEQELAVMLMHSRVQARGTEQLRLMSFLQERIRL